MQAKKAKAAAEHLLWSIGLQLHGADTELQSVRAKVEATNDRILSSRKIIARTDLLMEQIERFGSDKG